MNLETMYFEEYDDQRTEDFTLVGVEGKEPIAIVNLEVQVNELRRLNGRNAHIFVYRPATATC